MPNFAQATIIGHLGSDPTLRTTQSGPVASFSVATSRKRGQDENTTWWRCSMFGKRAEVLCQYLKKGDPVLVSGEPYLRPWTGQDGVEHVGLELMVSDFAFVGGKDGGQRAAAPSAGRAATAYFDADLPF